MSATSTFLIANVIGGLTVLGGYLICLYSFPAQREMLWGNIHGGLRYSFTVSMLLAAAGYLTFAYGVLFESNPTEFSSRLLNTKHAMSILCMIFLLSSASWMPATITYLKTRKTIWWIISVISLWITAISLFTATLIVISSPFAISSTSYRILTICGISVITYHCLVLDAIIWVSRFHIPLRN